MKTVQLAFPPSAPGHSWRILSLPARSSDGPRRILVVPGASVLARQASAPGRTPAQQQATALAGLMQEMASPAETCVCALEPTRSAQRLAFIASRSDLDRWLVEARAQGLDPDAIVPDFALLPVPSDARATIARIGEDVAVRTATAGFTCQSELVEVLTKGQELNEVDFDAAAAAGLAGGLLNRLPNLLLALPRQRPAPGASLAMAGVAALLGLCVLTSLPWIEAWRQDDAASRLRSKTEDLARSSLPDGSRIINPLAQLREASAMRRQATTSLSLADDLFKGLQTAPGVQMTQLALREDGGVVARLLAPDLALLQPLRDHLSGAGIAWEEIPLPSLPNSIPVDVSVRRGP